MLEQKPEKENPKEPNQAVEDMQTAEQGVRYNSEEEDGR